MNKSCAGFNGLKDHFTRNNTLNTIDKLFDKKDEFDVDEFNKQAKFF